MNKVMYTGHGEKTGGLQAHSVGDAYPFMVVGTHHITQDKPSDYTRYFVLDAATGRQFYFKSKRGEVRTWVDCEAAHLVAEMLAQGARPHYVVKV